MKIFSFSLIAIALFISITANSQKTKILFLGNSYVYTNDLPTVFENLGLSLGDTIYTDQNTPGGYRFLNHASDVNSLNKIQSDIWDFVVLQAQSQEPSWPPSQIETEVFPYAKILVDSIKANHSCSEPVFLMTWGRKYGDSYNCAGWPPVCTFLGMQERLMAGYMTMGIENESTVSPVGLAWKLAMDNDPDSLINLYSGDNSHPSFAGTYLTACVLYATIFNKTPIGSSYYGSLTESTALFLQDIAHQTVLGNDYNFDFYDTYTSTNYDLSWESWFENGNMVFADFDYTINETTGLAYFTDQSLNGLQYYWDFGNGSTSFNQNESTYFENGNYTISLAASNDCFWDSDTLIIDVILTEIDEQETNKVSLYPNPAKDYLYIERGKSESFQIRLTNMKGQIVMEDKISNSPTKVDISTLPPGTYQLDIIGNDGIAEIRRVIVL